MDRRYFLAALGIAGGGIVFQSRARRTTEQGALLRPPGAVSEADFLSRCIRCDHCIDVCPVDALQPVGPDVPHAVGSPRIIARSQPCTLCAGEPEMACMAVCPTDALRPNVAPDEVAVGVAVIDDATCLPFHGVTCRACWRACPFPDAAISFDHRGRPVVDPPACVGCGLCEHVCLTDPPSITIHPFASKEPRPKHPSHETS